MTLPDDAYRAEYVRRQKDGEASPMPDQTARHDGLGVDDWHDDGSCGFTFDYDAAPVLRALGLTT